MATPTEKHGQRATVPPQWDEQASTPLLRTLFLNQPGSYLHLQGGRLVVEVEGAIQLSLPIEKVDQVTALSEGAISFAAMRALHEHGGSLLVCGQHGQSNVWLSSASDSRVKLRHTQHQRQNDAPFGLRMAQNIVSGKIANSRLSLRRIQRHNPASQAIDVDKELADLQRRCGHADQLDSLRGLEGAAAKAYFAAWRQRLPQHWQPHFGPRQTQPPRDKVNAMLSYGYAILFQNLLTLVQQRGLDSHLGHLHAQRDEHPALVSDLMEEFRALVVDSVVLHLLQDEPAESKPAQPPTATGIHLPQPLRKRLVMALEDKLNSSLTHPLTREKGDYRRAMRTQVGHYIQVLQGESDSYKPFAPR